jgi:outer membrane phospholipase A
MMKLLSGSFGVYLHAQYFIGYGESLLLYNERGTSFRLGFSFYR